MSQDILSQVDFKVAPLFNGATLYPGPAAKLDDTNGTDKSLWVGTAAQYDAIGTKDANTLYMVEGGSSVPNTEAALSADVAMGTTGTWYDGPSLSLGAGTWLLTAQITFLRTTATATSFAGRISTGTTHYASSQFYQPAVANAGGNVALTAIVTLTGTTTIKVQGTTNAGAAACLMKASTAISGSGNNATRLTAIQLS